MSWNLILCLWLLRIWFIFVLSLAQKYSKKRQGIRGGSWVISFRRQWVNKTWTYPAFKNIQCSSDICELRIRVLYKRILRIRVCQYAHICGYIHALMSVYMSLCYAFPWVSLCEALLVKQRTLYFWEWKRLQSKICI